MSNLYGSWDTFGVKLPEERVGQFTISGNHAFATVSVDGFLVKDVVHTETNGKVPDEKMPSAFGRCQEWATRQQSKV